MTDEYASISGIEHASYKSTEHNEIDIDLIKTKVATRRQHPKITSTKVSKLHCQQCPTPQQNQIIFTS